MNENNNNIILNNKISNKNNYLLEMIRNQRKNIPYNMKLYLNDLRRIIDFIPSSIFTNECCQWQGYITNFNNDKKGTYVNFYYKKKKRALHRLLFVNFKDSLEVNEYVRFTCEHKGYCCSINCMYKVKYNNIKKLSNTKNIKNNISNKNINLNFEIKFE